MFLNRYFRFIIMLMSSCLLLTAYGADRTVNLVVGYKAVNFTGKTIQAIAVNNQIPAPTLHFKEGDQVTINVYNHLNVGTSIHWHGLLVPWQMDGVEGISQKAIPPGGVFHYQFTLYQSGTYWYHAHAGFQEQQGLYGAFIIDPPHPPAYHYNKDYVVVLSDWSNTNPDKIFANLKKEGDYYSTRFPLQPSLMKFIHDYRKASTAERKKLINDYKMMQQMRMSIYDISDVAYDAFLLNGEANNHPWTAPVKVGDIVRLRFIGAGGSTIFQVKIPGASMEMVHVEGNDVRPYMIKSFTIAPGETYDVLVHIRQNRPYIIYAESADTLGAAVGALITQPNQFVNYKNVTPFPEPAPVMVMAGMDHGSMNMNMGSDQSNSMQNMAMEQSSQTPTNTSTTNMMPSMNMDEDHSNHTMPTNGTENTNQPTSNQSTSQSMTMPMPQNSQTPTTNTSTTNTMPPMNMGEDHSNHTMPTNGTENTNQPTSNQSTSQSMTMPMPQNSQTPTTNTSTTNTMPPMNMGEDHSNHTMPTNGTENTNQSTSNQSTSQSMTMPMPQNSQAPSNTSTTNTMPSMNMGKNHSNMMMQSNSTKKSNQSMSHAMNMSMSMGGMQMDHGSMNMDNEATSDNPMTTGTKYQNLEAAVKTNNPNIPIQQVIHMDLNGYMDRYIWFINGVPEYKAQPILLEPGKRYRIIFVNNSMMHHPMHMHGHWFILRNGHGAYDPLLHTIDVAPGATVVVDVDTDASGQWFFHCHHMYHMMAGMARVFQYTTLIDITKGKAKPENIITKLPYTNQAIIRVDKEPIDTSLVTHPMAHAPGLYAANWLDMNADPFQNNQELTYKGLFGGDYNKLELFSNEAQINDGSVENADLDIFYWHLLSQFWAIKGGANYVYRPANTPYWQPGIGIEGLMPYFIATDVRTYYHDGSAKLDVELSRDTQITNKFFIRADIRSILATKTVTQDDVGSGLNEFEWAIRPYYQLNPTAALYIEYQNTNYYGAAKQLFQQENRSSNEKTLSVGISLLF